MTLPDLVGRIAGFKPRRPGHPPAVRHAAEERIAAGVAAFAVGLVFLVGMWGLGGTFPDGHFAAAANTGVIGYNMSRYGTVFAYWPFLDQPPPLSSAYVDHPMGLFWVAGLGIRLFGAHDWVLRLPAVAYVTLTALLIYRCGRAIWGPIEGALSALAFSALPITLGYTAFLDMEQPVMLGCVAATWGYIRFRQTGRGVYGLASVAGFAFALLHDWDAYIWGGSFLLFVYLRGFVLPERWLGRVNTRKLGRYLGAMAATAVVLLALTIGLVLHAGRLSELVSMYGVRSAGNHTPMRAVLAARHVRIELMFTALGIALGKIAVPVIVARFLLLRDELECLPLFLLLMSVAYYLLFKQAADVHIFWPHPFAVYFGLAIGALAASLRQGWAWLAPRLAARRGLPPRPTGRAAFVAAGLLAVPLLLVLRDGVSLIRLSRETGGRFMEVFAPSAIDRSVALGWFMKRFPPREPVAIHASLSKHWDTDWALRPRQLAWAQPVVAAAPRPFVLDARSTSLGELREAARRYHVVALGGYWLMDRGAPAAPIDGYRFDEHDPGPLESLWQGGTEPVRRVVADPWSTWEWRRLLDQPPAPAPAQAPVTDEQLRIAHNVALAKGDAAEAARLRAALVGRLAIRRTAKWSNGLELLGVAHHRGAARTLTLYVASGPGGTCPHIAVHARVTGRRFLSSLPVDPADVDISSPPSVPCELWQPGHIYAVPIVYRHRAGHEQLTLQLEQTGRTPAPTLVAGTPPLVLLGL